MSSPVSRRASRAGQAGLLFLAVLGTAGCPPSGSPERVCQSFLRAVSEGDATLIFERLSQPTQWAMYTVQKHHARMRQLVQTSYPAAEQSPALSRLYAADAENGRELFARLYAERYAPSFQARLGSGAARGELKASGAELYCRRENGSGAPFRLVREANGRYGLVELAEEWESAQLRATHDLATVEKNAEIYRQAGGSAGIPPGPPPGTTPSPPREPK